MKKIELSQGYFALVDDEDFEILSKYKWYLLKAKHTNYATRVEYKDGFKKRFSMHTMISGYKITDHINHNGLDNRKENLRDCTKRQNNCNRVKNKRSFSSYKGVSKRYNMFISLIRIKGKLKYLGQFETEIEAAKVYDSAANYYFGQFACLNFPYSVELYTPRQCVRPVKYTKRKVA